MLEIAVAIGRVVASAVLRAWVTSPALADATLQALVQHVDTSAKSLLTERNFERQLDRVADRIGDHLFDIVQRESVRMKDEDKRMVFECCLETLQGVSITPAVVAAAEGDGAPLSAEVLRVVTERARLSRAQSAAAERIVDRAMLMILDTVRGLPTYAPPALTRVIRGDEEIINRVEAVVDKLNAASRARVKPASTRAGQYEEWYRMSVISRFDQLQIIGLGQQSPRPHSLSVAYVALSMADVEHVEDDSSDSSRSVSVEQALASGNRILIAGDAGSGKTTLLQWIAVQAARDSFPADLDTWQKHIPFFVRFRQFATKKLPSLEELPLLITHARDAQRPTGWVDEIFEQGSAVLLLDGLDELETRRREVEVQEWITELLENRLVGKVIVSARPTAISDDWLEDFGFRRFDLKRMTPTQVANFVDYWHDAVRETIDADEDVRSFVTVRPTHLSSVR